MSNDPHLAYTVAGYLAIEAGSMSDWPANLKPEHLEVAKSLVHDFLLSKTWLFEIKK